MTPEFLWFADLVLLLRLRRLFTDAPVGGRGWTSKTLVEIGLLAILLPLDARVLAAMATSVVLNAVSAFGERRGRDRNGAQLIVGALHVAALSLCFGPAGAVAFRPWVPSVSAAVAGATTLGPAMRELCSPPALKIFFGLLIAANEANLLIRWVLDRLQLRPGIAAAAGIDVSEYARGRVIGMLERGLIYFFVLNGQFGAVGFTLAAKGFTRFKELENRGFAEYVLIGTLLSSGIAMLVAFAVARL